MKTWLLVCLLGALSGVVGCKPKATLPPLTTNALVQQAAEVDQAALMKMFLESFEKEAYATNAVARFQTTFNEAIVQKLTEQAPSELRRKLETLDRRSNRHPFTEEQLKEAIRRKERRE